MFKVLKLYQSNDSEFKYYLVHIMTLKTKVSTAHYVKHALHLHLLYSWIKHRWCLSACTASLPACRQGPRRPFTSVWPDLPPRARPSCPTPANRKRRWLSRKNRRNKRSFRNISSLWLPPFTWKLIKNVWFLKRLLINIIYPTIIKVCRSYSA